MSKKQNNQIEITKSNYKIYFKDWNRKEFRKYKKRLKMDLENNPIIFNKYYNPVSSSIWNPINMSYQAGKSNNARYNNK